MSLTDHLFDYFEIDDDLASPYGIHRRENMTQKPDAEQIEDTRTSETWTPHEVSIHDKDVFGHSREPIGTEPKRLDIKLPDDWGEMEDGSEMPETIWAREKDALTAELKELREFVGAIKRMEFNGLLGRYEGKEFWFYGDDHKIVATGTDPFDAWRKMNVGEGE